MPTLVLLRTALLVAVLSVAATAWHEWDGGALKIALGVAELAGVGWLMHWVLNRPAPAVSVPISRQPAWLLPLVVAFGVRLLWIVVAQTKPMSDFQEYCDLGIHLAQTGVFGLAGPSAYRPPALPAVLAVFHLLGLPLPLATGVFHALLGAVAVPAVHFLAGRLATADDDPQQLPPRAQSAALLAAWLWALWPSQVLGSVIVATEPLFTVVLLWSLVFCLRALAQPKFGRALGWAIAAGIGFGLAGYVRSHALVVPWLWAGLLVLHGRAGWRRLPKLAVVCACSVLVLVPWGLRNQRQVGQFLITTTSSAMTLVYGNHPKATGRYGAIDFEVPGNTELEVFHNANRMGQAWITDNPAQFVALIPKKWLALLALDTDEASFALRDPPLLAWRPAAFAVCTLAWIVAKALAFAAVWRRRSPLNTDGLMACTAVLWTWLLIHALFHGQFRYHAAWVPVVLALAAVALRRGDRMDSRKTLP
ncbi:MAG: hypothetical protein EXR77_19730 [Myxococcales bacterium]|nr:hypothetical protein [Myxococcales bacterium]